VSAARKLVAVIGKRFAGPPITVGCPCGARLEVAHGNSCTCSCGLRWDTTQIEDEYQQLLRVHRRYRTYVPTALGLATCALILALFFTGNLIGIFALLAVVLFVRSTVVRPVLGRRYAAALAQLPQWTLRPTTPSGQTVPGDDRPGSQGPVQDTPVPQDVRP
jgi:hypothetical protein